jgi:hypothetical protein
MIGSTRATYSNIPDGLSPPSDVVIEPSLSQKDTKWIPTFDPFRFSNLFFTWYETQIALGSRRSLTKGDMMLLPPFMTSAEVFCTFKQCWILEAMRLRTVQAGYASTSPGPNDSEKNPKLWRVLHTLIFTEFWLCGLCRLVNDGLLVLGTIWIKYIVRAAEEQDFEAAFFYALMITLSSITQALVLQQFIHGEIKFFSHSNCISFIYYKSRLPLQVPS